MSRLFPALFAALVFCGMLAGGAAADSMNQTENAFDRPGGDYHSYNAGNVSACSTSCGTVARCRSFTFDRTNGMCWMKESVPAKVANGCCQSGVKAMGEMELGTDRPGSDLKPGFDVTTPSSCERTCRLDGNCRAYTFVKAGVQGPSAKCWLKSSRPAKVASPCCVSGVRLTTPPPHRNPNLPGSVRID